MLTLIFILFPIVAFLFTWAFLFDRLAQGKGILPKQNLLRRARWRGDACFLILGSFVAIPSFALTVMMFLTQEAPIETPAEKSVEIPAEKSVEIPAEKSVETPAEKSVEIPAEKSVETPAEKSLVEQEGDSQTEHSALVFLEKNPSSLKFLFMALYIVLVAPFFEEFIFRLIIQGWFDAREREIFWKRRGNGWRSVILVALLFSFMHFREATSSYPSEHTLGVQFGTLAVTSILILAFSIWLLKGPLGLNWREIGLDFRFWKKDLCLGALGFGAAAEATYLIQAALEDPLKNYCAPDFIALIPIALVFGILYWRTRRLLPGFTAHAIFNGFSILQLFALYLTKSTSLPL